jgi:calpain-15
VLIYKSIVIYLLPCIGVYVGRASWGFIGTFCCFLCKCCGCYYYKDSGFDGVEAIGDADAVKDVEFVRANELDCVKEGQRMRLFAGKIEPADLCQGAIGDCWLVAAMASLASTPAPSATAS